MIIYPAIDIMEGKCVRLQKGDFDTKTIFNPNPVAQARCFFNDGAQWIHIVDLDGAKQQSPQNTVCITEIASSNPAKIQTGGGIRSMQDAETLLNAGASRVIIGSIAIKNSDLCNMMLSEFGPEQVVLALDVRFRNNAFMLTSGGWKYDEELSLTNALDFFCEHDLKHILVTDIERDGLLQGPNTDLYKILATKYQQLSVQASGGVGTLEHVRGASASGVQGLIIGRALYEKRFTFGEAANAAQGESHA